MLNLFNTPKRALSTLASLAAVAVAVFAFIMLRQTVEHGWTPESRLRHAAEAMCLNGCSEDDFVVRDNGVVRFHAWEAPAPGKCPTFELPDGFTLVYSDSVPESTESTVDHPGVIPRVC